jgi:hypothetical protein
MNCTRLPFLSDPQCSLDVIINRTILISPLRLSLIPDVPRAQLAMHMHDTHRCFVFVVVIVFVFVFVFVREGRVRAASHHVHSLPMYLSFTTLFSSSLAHLNIAAGIRLVILVQTY